jgi:nucleoside-diphosphate-sugar epimerase
VASGIYNMCDDEALSTNDLITVICKALGKKTHIWYLPKGLMNLMSRIGDILHLPLNSERLTKLTENYVVSNTKIKKALGVDKMPIRAEEGLTQTIKSFVNTK